MTMLLDSLLHLLEGDAVNNLGTSSFYTDNIVTIFVKVGISASLYALGLTLVENIDSLIFFIGQNTVQTVFLKFLSSFCLIPLLMQIVENL